MAVLLAVGPGVGVGITCLRIRGISSPVRSFDSCMVLPCYRAMRRLNDVSAFTLI